MNRIFLVDCEVFATESKSTGAKIHHKYERQPMHGLVH